MSSKNETIKAHLVTGIGELVSMQGAAKKNGRHVKEKDLSISKKQAFLTFKGRLLWVGSEKKLSKATLKKAGITVKKETDLEGRTVLPGFVESHTHTVFAGSRQDEFEKLNSGMSYQKVTEQGGGIQSTVVATRKASEANLVTLAQSRVDQFISQGVTFLETKSGYGLNHASELKLLRVASQLKKIPIVRTYLGAHAIPKGVKLDAYIKEICEKTLPQIAKKNLADRIDIFIEKGFYTPKHAQQIFETAQGLGLPIAAHVEQLSHSKGIETALKYQAASVEHIVHASDKDIKLLSESETIANLLPTADFYLKIDYPPARKLLDAGCRVSLATDFNPGSAPSLDLSMVGVLARLQMKMSLPEVLAAYTLNAAASLGKSQETGSLSEKKSADFTVLDDDWDQLFYKIGYHPVAQTWSRGRRIYKKTR